VIELLAITDDVAPVSPPLCAIRSGDLSVLCRPASPREVTPEALWSHDAMLEALMAERDLLPVRYGTVVPDERAAARALAERQEQLMTSLDRVRGAVELALRVQPLAKVSPASGRDYLRAKVAGLQASRRLHERLDALARASVIKPGPELLRAAYLVDHDAVEQFAATVRDLQDAEPELALLCTGPWPPYSFAEGEPAS
jgi:hypothetical protein